MLSDKQQFFKRSFDLVLSTLLLIPCTILIFIIVLPVFLKTFKLPFFSQKRVGSGAKSFNLIKIRTLFSEEEINSFPPKANWSYTKFIRETKLDELPQIYLIWLGTMSFVGPRPDLPGYLDRVNKQYQSLWLLKPGLTGPATLKYRNEDQLLKDKAQPEKFNDEVIWPDKLKINMSYFENYSFWTDLNILIKSVTR